MSVASAIGATLTVAAAAAEGIAHVLDTLAAPQSPRQKAAWARTTVATDSLASTIASASSGSSAASVAPGEVGRQPLDELIALRTRLACFDGAMPTRTLDPKVVHASRWSHRHPASWDSSEFAGLKESIAVAGGNVQPVLVREVADPDGNYEIVFGHRRVRACVELGLPVLAVIWNKAVDPADMFLLVEMENRNRANPSAFEQGKLYIQALESRLFPSARRLAAAIGVSHTWLNQVIKVANLDQDIVCAFRTPLEIQPRHVAAIEKSLRNDPAGVLARAREMAACDDDEKASSSAVVRRLEGRDGQVDVGTPIKLGTRKIGEWRRDKNGQVLITLLPLANEQAAMEQITRSILAAVQAVET